jgi:hypothetical protein
MFSDSLTPRPALIDAIRPPGYGDTLYELFSVNHARPPGATAMSSSEGEYGPLIVAVLRSLAWIPLLEPGETAVGSANLTMPSFCTNHIRLPWES